MPEQWCDHLLWVVCVTPVDEFPFWEVIASATITAAVTWLTIWASIRGARRETERTIRASLQAERRARVERERNAARADDAEASRQRLVLATALSRGVHSMQAVRNLPPDDRTRMEAEAEWSALHISFKVSPATQAADLYDFADLRVDHADSVGPPPEDNDATSLIKHVSQTVFAEKISDAASYWAKHSVLAPEVDEELALLRLAREKRREERDDDLMRSLRRLEDLPQALESELFAEDPNDV